MLFKIILCIAFNRFSGFFDFANFINLRKFAFQTSGAKITNNSLAYFISLSFFPSKIVKRILGHSKQFLPSIVFHLPPQQFYVIAQHLFQLVNSSIAHAHLGHFLHSYQKGIAGFFTHRIGFDARKYFDVGFAADSFSCNKNCAV